VIGPGWLPSCGTMCETVRFPSLDREDWRGSVLVAYVDTELAMYNDAEDGPGADRANVASPAPGH
jgi:hypothetical protein